jgi:hypothetical protein
VIVSCMFCDIPSIHSTCSKFSSILASSALSIRFSLANYPEVREEAQQEIDRVMGSVPRSYTERARYQRFEVYAGHY